MSYRQFAGAWEATHGPLATTMTSSYLRLIDFDAVAYAGAAR